MSKIQEALDKLKENRQILLHSNRELSTSDIAKDNEASIREIPEERIMTEISSMSQPSVFTTDIMEKMRIIHSQMADRKAFNAFRDLRTSVIQKINDVNPIIMITSCSYSQGTSFIAKNLAASFAMAESSTSLLVDCNLSSPKFNDLAVAEIKLGLTEYLRDYSRSIEELILPSGIPRMRVIPVGNAELPVGELFSSVRLRKLFDNIKNRYTNRYIIVDSPPIAEEADARILAQVCDYVVLVVSYGKTTEAEVKDAVRIIGQEKMLGVVFNDEPRIPGFSRS